MSAAETRWTGPLQNMKTLPVRALGILTAFLAAVPLAAPADITVDVSPAKYELQTTAGKSETFPITVRNSGTVPVHILTAFSDFTVNTSGNYEFIAPGKAKYSIGNWISLNPREFDADAGSTAQVRFTVNVPSGASGEYAGMAFFQTRPTRRAGGVSISERIASKIYVLVGDGARLTGEIDDVSAPSLADGQHYLVGFRNTGNAHVYLSGRIEVKQGSQVVERVVIPPGQLVERAGRRIIDATGKKLPAGSYNIVALIDYGGPNLVAGQTTLTVR